MLSVAGTATAGTISLELSDFVIFSGGGGNTADGGDETIIGGHTAITGNIGSNQDLFLQGNPLPGYPALLTGSAYAGGNLEFGQDLTVNGSAVANGDAAIGGDVSMSGTLDAASYTLGSGATTGGIDTSASRDTFALITMPTATSFTTLGTTDARNAETFALSPDTYGTLALTGDNNITLSSGDYYFAAITTAAGSNNNLYLDLTSGDAINIYVAGVLDFDTQNNKLYVKGPGDTTWALIKDRSDLAGLIYWETNDQFLLGGSSIWGGTVYSTLQDGFGIDVDQYINYTGAAWAFDSVRIKDHGTWNYVPLADPVPVPEPMSLLLLGTGLVGLAARVRARAPIKTAARGGNR